MICHVWNYAAYLLLRCSFLLDLSLAFPLITLPPVCFFLLRCRLLLLLPLCLVQPALLCLLLLRCLRSAHTTWMACKTKKKKIKKEKDKNTCRQGGYWPYVQKWLMQKAGRLTTGLIASDLRC